MPEYRAVLLGSAANLNDLAVYAPQEEGTPEGSLMLLEIQLGSAIPAATIDEINLKCAEAGVIPWTGLSQIAFTDLTGQVLTLQWVKAFAFMPIIVGILLLTVLPAILGAVIWWLIPESIKQIINMVIMMLVMMMMMKMITPMISAGKKEKES